MLYDFQISQNVRYGAKYTQKLCSVLITFLNEETSYKKSGVLASLRN